MSKYYWELLSTSLLELFPIDTKTMDTLEDEYFVKHFLSFILGKAPPFSLLSVHTIPTNASLALLFRIHLQTLQTFSRLLEGFLPEEVILIEEDMMMTQENSSSTSSSSSYVTKFEEKLQFYQQCIQLPGLSDEKKEKVFRKILSNRFQSTPAKSSSLPQYPALSSIFPQREKRVIQIQDSWKQFFFDLIEYCQQMMIAYYHIHHYQLPSYLKRKMEERERPANHLPSWSSSPKDPEPLIIPAIVSEVDLVDSQRIIDKEGGGSGSAMTDEAFDLWTEEMDKKSWKETKAKYQAVGGTVLNYWIDWMIFLQQQNTSHCQLLIESMYLHYPRLQHRLNEDSNSIDVNILSSLANVFASLLQANRIPIMNSSSISPSSLSIPPSFTASSCSSSSYQEIRIIPDYFYMLLSSPFLPLELKHKGLQLLLPLLLSDFRSVRTLVSPSSVS